MSWGGLFYTTAVDTIQDGKGVLATIGTQKLSFQINEKCQLIYLNVYTSNKPNKCKRKLFSDHMM